MTLENGARLGHYHILGLLGRGGMADVYRAEDERLGREVALKLVPPEFARDPERVARFEREVRAAAKLTHPNIVTVHEFGRETGQPFYAMELMPGGDLKAKIRAHAQGMEPSESRAVAVAIARALEYAHKRGFVHRDVKPENILFGEDGTAQLTDFGIARAMSSGTRMTAVGMSIGSPHYMSPEQARGQPVDGRSDLYSLGVVLYEMLTGKVPFDAADTFAVGLSHINDPVPKLQREIAGWQPVLDRLLAKSPADRYRTAAELADALGARRVATAKPVRSSARSADARKRSKGFAPRPAGTALSRRGLAAVLAGAGLALAAVGIAFVAVRGFERRGGSAPGAGGGGGSVRSTATRPTPPRRVGPANPTSPFDFVLPESARPAPKDFSSDESDAEERPAPPEPPRPRRRSPPPPEPSPVLGGSASLVVETTPPGVEVLVDGERVGDTPLERPDIGAGVREVTLRHPHYEAAQISGQRFQDGRVVRIERALVRGRGALTVAAMPREAWIDVDGERLADRTPVTLEGLQAGPVRLMLGAPDHLPRIVEVDVPMNGLARVEPRLERGDVGRLDAGQLRQLADQGHPGAQFNLAVGYRTGRGVPQDDAEAVRWLRRAAERGHTEARYNLGVRYRTGWGVPKDGVGAIRWLRRAAEQGHASGQYDLGVMYDTGEGVPEDDVEAVRWFRRAAEQGHAAGQNSVGQMYQNGWGVAEDPGEAVRWFRRAAEQGHADGQLSVGIMYRTGAGVERDDAEAVRWFRQAADQGQVVAQFHLGRAYQYGLGVRQDLGEAARWYRRAADQGSSAAQRALEGLR